MPCGYIRERLKRRPGASSTTCRSASAPSARCTARTSPTSNVMPSRSRPDERSRTCRTPHAAGRRGWYSARADVSPRKASLALSARLLVLDLLHDSGHGLVAAEALGPVCLGDDLVFRRSGRLELRAAGLAASRAGFAVRARGPRGLPGQPHLRPAIGALRKPAHRSKGVLPELRGKITSAAGALLVSHE